MKLFFCDLKHSIILHELKIPKEVPQDFIAELIGKLKECNFIDGRYKALLVGEKAEITYYDGESDIHLE